MSFSVGDHVTGVPGRVGHGWHGIVRGFVEPKPNGDGGKTHRLVCVWWKEREQATEKLSAHWKAIRRQPELSHRFEQLEKVSHG